MGLEIPPEVQWLSWIIGQDWPEGDETAMRRLATAWQDAASGVDEVTGDLQGAASKVLGVVQGEAADSFEKFWNTFVTTDPEYLPKLAEACRKLAEQCDNGANEIEYGKYMFIALLIITAIQIAILIANMIETFGASAAGIPVVEAGAQVAARTIAKQLLIDLLKAVFWSELQSVGLDVLIQGVQMAEGHRKSWDWGKTGSAAIDGAVNGVIGLGVGKGVGKIPGLSGAESPFKGMVQGAAREAVSGTVSGVAGAVTSTAIHGGDLSFDGLAKAASSGAFGGAVGGAKGGMHEGAHAGAHSPESPGSGDFNGTHSEAGSSGSDGGTSGGSHDDGSNASGGSSDSGGGSDDSAGSGGTSSDGGSNEGARTTDEHSGSDNGSVDSNGGSHSSSERGSDGRTGEPFAASDNGSTGSDHATSELAGYDGASDATGHAGPDTSGTEPTALHSESDTASAYSSDSGIHPSADPAAGGGHPDAGGGGPADASSFNRVHTALNTDSGGSAHGGSAAMSSVSGAGSPSGPGGGSSTPEASSNRIDSLLNRGSSTGGGPSTPHGSELADAGSATPPMATPMSGTPSGPGRGENGGTPSGSSEPQAGPSTGGMSMAPPMAGGMPSGGLGGGGGGHASSGGRSMGGTTAEPRAYQPSTGTDRSGTGGTDRSGGTTADRRPGGSTGENRRPEREPTPSAPSPEERPFSSSEGVPTLDIPEPRVAPPAEASVPESYDTAPGGTSAEPQETAPEHAPDDTSAEPRDAPTDQAPEAPVRESHETTPEGTPDRTETDGTADQGHTTATDGTATERPSVNHETAPAAPADGRAPIDDEPGPRSEQPPAGRVVQEGTPSGESRDTSLGHTQETPVREPDEPAPTAGRRPAETAHAGTREPGTEHERREESTPHEQDRHNDGPDATHDGSGDGGTPDARTSEEQLQAAEDEARQILDQLGSDAPTVDYSRLDPAAARAINESLRTLVADYPDVVRELNHVGSNDPINDFSGPDGTLAYALTSGSDQGVYLNPDSFGDANRLASDGVHEEATNWVVPGGGGAEGIFNHEFGHQLGQHLLDDPAALADLNKAVSDTIGSPYDASQPHDPATEALITQHLSEYGSSDSHEMMAEAFAEYRGSDNPRPLAEAIGRVMDQHLRAPETAPHDGSAEPAASHERQTAHDDGRSIPEPRDGGPETRGPSDRDTAKPDERHGTSEDKGSRHTSSDEPGTHRRQGSAPEEERPPAEEHSDRPLTEGDDGRLHREGDSEGTYRSEDGKLHFKGDPENTFRNDLTHRLHGEGGRFVDDPFTKRDIDYRASESESAPHEPSDAARHKLDSLAEQRRIPESAAAAHRAQMKKIYQDELAPYAERIAEHHKGFRIDRPSDLSNPKLARKINLVKKAIIEDGALTPDQRAAKLIHLENLETLARQHNQAMRDMVVLSERMGMEGAKDYAVNERGGTLLTPLKEKLGTPGTIDVVSFADDPPRLISVEAKGGSDNLGSRLVEDGKKAQQGSPEYLKWILERDPDLHAALKANPAIRARIEEAIRANELQFEYHHIHVGIDGSVKHSEFRLQREDEPFRSKVSGAKSLEDSAERPAGSTTDGSEAGNRSGHDRDADQPRMRRRRMDDPPPDEPEERRSDDSNDEPTGQGEPSDPHHAQDGDHGGHTDQPGQTPPDPRHDVANATAEAKATVTDQVGTVSPELSSVVNHLLDDPHQLNVTAALHDPATREQTVALIRELGEGESTGPYGGDLRAFLNDRPGTGPLFEPVPHEVNHDENGHSRMQDYVEHAKQVDPARQVGREPTPEQEAQVREYAQRLKNEVEPAVRREIDQIIKDLGGDAGAASSVRTKDAAGLHDKVNRMTAGRPGSPGREGYRVGDVIDAVEARITVRDMASLSALYERVQSHYGIGDGGRVLEIENMYAEPKAKAPEYRVIPMIIGTEINGVPYTFELQLTTRRASIAADIEHNSIYKPYIPVTAAERDAVKQAMAEAAALDQLETRGTHR